MTPLPFVWPYWPAFWAVFFWAFLPEYHIVKRAKAPAASAGSPDAGSYRVITRGMGVATAAAFPLAWVDALRLPRAAQPAVLVAGTLILVAGSLLRRHCWRQLGAAFTGDVRAQPDQAVIQSGAYAVVRHPSYTAGILMNTGMGVALGSWGSALLLAVVSVAVYGYRIAIEERAMLVVIGEPYRHYMQSRRWRLVPLVY